MWWCDWLLQWGRLLQGSLKLPQGVPQQAAEDEVCLWNVASKQWVICQTCWPFYCAHAEVQVLLTWLIFCPSVNVLPLCLSAPLIWNKCSCCLTILYQMPTVEYIIIVGAFPVRRVNQWECRIGCWWEVRKMSVSLISRENWCIQGDYVCVIFICVIISKLHANLTRTTVKLKIVI